MPTIEEIIRQEIKEIKDMTNMDISYWKENDNGSAWNFWEDTGLKEKKTHYLYPNPLNCEDIHVSQKILRKDPWAKERKELRNILKGQSQSHQQQKPRQPPKGKQQSHQQQSHQQQSHQQQSHQQQQPKSQTTGQSSSTHPYECGDGSWNGKSIKFKKKINIKKFLKINPNKEGNKYFKIEGKKVKFDKETWNQGKEGKEKYVRPSIGTNKLPTTIEYNFITKERGEKSNDDLFSESKIKENIDNGKNIFLAAFGTSGSGKTFTLGLDTTSGMKGVVGKAITHIMSKNPSEIELLSLQIYKGNVYNSKFIGGEKGLKIKIDQKDYYPESHHKGIDPDDIEINIKNDSDKTDFEWFVQDKYKHVIPEFNYKNMLNPKVLERCYPDVCSELGSNPYGVNYPPSKSLIHALFESGEDVIPFQGGTDNNIMDYIQNHITKRRPTRVTPENPGGSSRSHLFLLFRYKIAKSGNYKYFNVLDLAGYEQVKRGTGIRGNEGRDIVDSIKQFRKLVQYSTGKLQVNQLPPGQEYFDLKTTINTTKSGNNPIVSTNLDTRNIQAAYSSTPYHNYAANFIKPQAGLTLAWCDDNNTKRLGPLYKKKGANTNEFDDVECESSAMFNVLRGVSGILNDDNYEHIIYVTLKEKEELKPKVSLADTIGWEYGNL